MRQQVVLRQGTIQQQRNVADHDFFISRQRRAKPAGVNELISGRSN